MSHDLIATVALGLSVAFAGGVLAHKLRLPVIVGYLLAGVAVGPFTPGPVADSQIASELAEVGVILLMFGVGIHFSLSDLARVWRIAVPGAVGQIALAAVLGLGLASLWGWSIGGGAAARPDALGRLDRGADARAVGLRRRSNRGRAAPPWAG